MDANHQRERSESVSRHFHEGHNCLWLAKQTNKRRLFPAWKWRKTDSDISFLLVWWKEKLCKIDITEQGTWHKLSSYSKTLSLLNTDTPWQKDQIHENWVTETWVFLTYLRGLVFSVEFYRCLSIKDNKICVVICIPQLYWILAHFSCLTLLANMKQMINVTANLVVTLQLVWSNVTTNLAVTLRLSWP